MSIRYRGAYPATSLYGITKLALVGLTTTLASQLGQYQINVNAIASGYTKTSAGLGLAPEGSQVDKTLGTRAAVNFRAEPEELLGPSMLLVSEAGNWMTGQVLHFDGGITMRS